MKVCTTLYKKQTCPFADLNGKAQHVARWNQRIPNIIVSKGNNIGANANTRHVNAT